MLRTSVLCSSLLWCRDIHRVPAPRMELGLQVDPAASVGSLFALGSFAWLQLKIKGAEAKREERDAAAEMLRKAEVLLLAGKLTSEEAERARDAAREASEAYEDARRIAALPGVALLRIPDPTRARAERLLQQERAQRQAPPQAPNAQAGGAGGAAETNGGESSLLPSGSSRVGPKDLAIGAAFVLQVAWFCLSLTDPMGAPSPVLNAALTSGGEYVDRLEAKRAAQSDEYAAMLQAAVDSGEAPPTCATRKLGEGEAGGCGADREFARTRGLDSNRGWISGPPGGGAAAAGGAFEALDGP